MSIIFALNPSQSLPISPLATTPATGTTSTSSSSSQNSAESIGSTFLTLLTQELQNQDPTAPMDSNEMVGQMISLNQLDQLAGINQLLTNQFPSASPTTGTQAAANAISQSQASAAAVVQAALQALNASSATASASSPSVSLPSL